MWLTLISSLTSHTPAVPEVTSQYRDRSKPWHSRVWPERKRSKRKSQNLNSCHPVILNWLSFSQLRQSLQGYLRYLGSPLAQLGRYRLCKEWIQDLVHGRCMLHLHYLPSTPKTISGNMFSILSSATSWHPDKYSGVKWEGWEQFQETNLRTHRDEPWTVSG